MADTVDTSIYKPANGLAAFDPMHSALQFGQLQNVLLQAQARQRELAEKVATGNALSGARGPDGQFDPSRAATAVADNPLSAGAAPEMAKNWAAIEHTRAGTALTQEQIIAARNEEAAKVAAARHISESVGPDGKTIDFGRAAVATARDPVAARLAPSMFRQHLDALGVDLENAGKEVTLAGNKQSLIAHTLGTALSQRKQAVGPDGKTVFSLDMPAVYQAAGALYPHLTKEQQKQLLKQVGDLEGLDGPQRFEAVQQVANLAITTADQLKLMVERMKPQWSPDGTTLVQPPGRLGEPARVLYEAPSKPFNVPEGARAIVATRNADGTTSYRQVAEGGTKRDPALQMKEDKMVEAGAPRLVAKAVVSGLLKEEKDENGRTMLVDTGTGERIEPAQAEAHLKWKLQQRGPEQQGEAGMEPATPVVPAPATGMGPSKAAEPLSMQQAISPTPLSYQVPGPMQAAPTGQPVATAIPSAGGSATAATATPAPAPIARGARSPFAVRETMDEPAGEGPVQSKGLMTNADNATGPTSFVKNWAQRVGGAAEDILPTKWSNRLFSLAVEVPAAGQALKNDPNVVKSRMELDLAGMALARAISTNRRYGATTTDRKDMEARFEIKPELLDSGVRLRDRIRQVDDYAKLLLKENREVFNDRLAPKESKNEAYNTIKALESWRKLAGVEDYDAAQKLKRDAKQGVINLQWNADKTKLVPVGQ